MRKSSIRKLPSSVGSQVLEAVQDTYMSLFLEIFSRHLTLPPKIQLKTIKKEKKTGHCSQTALQDYANINVIIILKCSDFFIGIFPTTLSPVCPILHFMD